MSPSLRSLPSPTCPLPALVDTLPLVPSCREPSHGFSSRGHNGGASVSFHRQMQGLDLGLRDGDRMICVA